MKCVHPITLSSGTFPCGKCIACRVSYTQVWGTRIRHESMYHEKNCFVTLTYNDENIPKNCFGGFTLRKNDVSLFMRKLRKITGKKIRFFCGGEYGEIKGRPHYHLVLFGIGEDAVESVVKAWKENGFITISPLTDYRCDYVAKYIFDKKLGASGIVYEKECREPEFSLMSRNPGIGAVHVEKNARELRARGFLVNKKGKKMALPKYYKNKIDKEYFSSVSNTNDYDRMIELRKKNPKEYIDISKKELLNREGRESLIKAGINLRRKKVI